MHTDPNSPYAELTKRQQEVLDRLEQGRAVKEIADDIGVSRNAVYQHIERLRRQGALAETYTPSGQPPRRLDLGNVTLPAAAAAPRDSGLLSFRDLAWDGDDLEGSTYARLIERAIADGDAVALAYELGRLDAQDSGGLARDLVESALRRLSVLPSDDQNPNP